MTHSKVRQENISSIAKRAGVSIATVSRAINSETRHKVSEPTLRKIDAIVKKYRYAVNVAAKNLRSVRSKMIGLLIPHEYNIFESNYFSRVLSGVSNYLANSDYGLRLILAKSNRRFLGGVTESEENFHEDQLFYRSSEGVDGLIMTQWKSVFKDSASLEKIDVPVVVIEDPAKSGKAHFVCCDNVQGGRLAAEHFYKNGHRKIAVLTGFSWSTDSRLRLFGFKQYLREKKISISSDLIACGNYTEQGAESAISRLLASRNKFTAIFCMNDEMAFGAVRQLERAGLRVPNDISLIGFDDEIRSAFFTPRLTTIFAPIREFGRIAAETLVTHLTDGDKDNFYGKINSLPVRLIERQSVQNVG